MTQEEMAIRAQQTKLLRTQGMQEKEIAKKLNVSVRTVRRDVRQMRPEMEEAAREAIEKKIALWLKYEEQRAALIDKIMAEPVTDENVYRKMRACAMLDQELKTIEILRKVSPRFEKERTEEIWGELLEYVKERKAALGIGGGKQSEPREGAVQ